MSSFLEKLMGGMLAISAVVTLHTGFAKINEPIPETSDKMAVINQVDEKLEAYDDMIDDLGDIVDAAEKLKGGEDESNPEAGQVVSGGEGPYPKDLQETLRSLGFEIADTLPNENTAVEGSDDQKSEAESSQSGDGTADGEVLDPDKKSLYEENDDGTLEIKAEAGEIRDGHTADGTGEEQLNFDAPVDTYVAAGALFEVNENKERVYPDTGNATIPQGEMEGTWQSRSENYKQSEVDQYLDKDSEKYNPANYERCMAQCRCDAYSEIYAAPYYQLSEAEQNRIGEEQPDVAAEMKRTVWDRMSPEERQEMRETNPQRAEILENNFFERMESADGEFFDALDFGYTYEEMEARAEALTKDGEDYPNMAVTPTSKLEELESARDVFDAVKDDKGESQYSKEKEQLEAVDNKHLKTGIIEPNKMYASNDGFKGEHHETTLKTGDVISRFNEAGTEGGGGRFACRAERGADGKLQGPSYESRSMVGFKERMQEKFYEVAPCKKVETTDNLKPEAQTVPQEKKDDPVLGTAAKTEPPKQTEAVAQPIDEADETDQVDPEEEHPEYEEDQQGDQDADNSQEEDDGNKAETEPQQQTAEKEAIPEKTATENAPNENADQKNSTRPPDQSPNQAEVARTAESVTDSTGKMDPSQQEAAFARLMDYMSSHNYSQMDYPTYSQDPTWRLLHSEAYPDYELPPMKNEMTQEEAFEKLQDYMNEHNYGSQDFDKYSQDPEWRALEKAAYPDYELPEYRNDGETQKDAEVAADGPENTDQKSETQGEVTKPGTDSENNPEAGKENDPEAGKENDPAAEKENDPEGGKENDPEGGKENDPEGGKENDPESGKENDPETGKENDPEAGKENGPESGKENDPEAVKENDPESGKENDPEAGKENDPESGKENDPETGKENNPEAGKENDPETGKENDPEAGKENGPESGKENDPEAGKENDPEVGKENDPESGKKENDPEAGKENDPEAVKENDPESGKENDPEAGKENDPEARKENDPEVGKENDPETGKENDPETGKENNPEAGKENDPEAGKENKTDTGSENTMEAPNEVEQEDAKDGGDDESDFSEFGNQSAKENTGKNDANSQSEFYDFQKNQDSVGDSGDNSKDGENPSEFDDFQTSGRENSAQTGSTDGGNDDFGDMKTQEKESPKAADGEKNESNEFSEHSSKKEKEDTSNTSEAEHDKSTENDDMQAMRNVDTSDIKTDDNPPETAPIDNGDGGDGNHVK